MPAIRWRFIYYINVECEKIERGIGVEWSGVYFMIIYYYCNTLGGIIVVYVTYKIFIL